MPQTRNGASENPWILYMKACAASYRAGHTHHSVEGPPVEAETSEKPPVKKRITKKQPESKAVDVEVKPTTGKGKAAKPITGQDVSKAVRKTKVTNK
jgi:hypothetical protein